MKLLTKSLIAMSALISSFFLHAQRTTEFFYLGNVYCKAKSGVEQRFPYLPVYLSLQDKPNDIIAVTMTNANGEASFKGMIFLQQYLNILLKTIIQMVVGNMLQRDRKSVV